MDLTGDVATTDTTDTTETSDVTEDMSGEVSAVEVGVADYFANKPDNSYLIAQDELVELVKAGEDMVVLDIRSADDYAAGHLKGAINVPWGTAISENLTSIPQDKDVYIYCYSGQTAGQAVMTLNLAGINARSAKYGWNFGISKVEGVEEVIETTENTFDGTTYEVDADIQAAIAAYYEGLADVAGTTYANYKISEDDLAALMASDEDFLLLSIRTADDYAAGHIEGAENLPYGKTIAEGFDSLPTDKKIVVYCYSGQTAGQTVAALRLLGYDAVSLNGGVGTTGNEPLGWVNKGYELVQE
jgi:rhodanese-related sulfurtransferase